ncbi:MAG: hypothetical protein ACUVTP_08460 [Candidatus Fervidibacter sp.]|uniref:hypothetical protein n=1 Tax=Candidatus Fervidibacter sp. TaxID=3100871 RepID=UPI00404A190C
MRWLIFVGMIALSFLTGCERIKRGEVEVAVQPAQKEAPAKPVLRKPKPVQTETPPQEQPIGPEAAIPQIAVPETVAQPTTPQPTATSPAEVSKPETGQPPMTATAETVGINFADEARSARSSADALHSQFDRLPVGEIKSRLLLLNQAISELEVRSPALVLWRTALRLEVVSKAPYPDVTIARAWLSRARTILAEQKVGLTSLSNSESALKAGDWKTAVNVLREAAAHLKAAEQAEALTQVRSCVLNALEAMERQKSSVAKAEVGEAVKALDKLISVLQ